MTSIYEKGLMMAISSIHIQAGKLGFFAHNSREKHTNNSIFSDEENYCSCSKDQAFKIYREELKKRKENYRKRIGQNIQKRSITHLSAIFNFQKETTIQEAQNVCKYLEDLLDTKVIQLAMHRDEGHIVEKDMEDLHGNLQIGSAIKNYHGHIEMLGIDSQGNSIRRKLDKPTLRKIQTDIANILNMERGRQTSYSKKEYILITSHLKPKEEYQDQDEYKKAFNAKAKELGLLKEKKVKRLDTYEYKRHIKELVESRREDLVKINDLKQEISILRNELKAQQVPREYYAQLEQFNKDLKHQIKEKDLTIDSLYRQIEDYKNQIDNRNKQRVRSSEEKISKVNHSDIDLNLNDDRDMHQNTMAILEDVLKKQANIRNNILNQKRKNNDHIDNYSVFDDNDSIKKNSRTIANRDIE